MGKQLVKHSIFFAILVMGALSSCATTQRDGVNAPSSCNGSIEANRKIVLEFYKEGLVNLQPRAAFLRHMSPEFIEHKADVPDGTRYATILYLERLIANVPQPRWEVIRTVAEDDFVFLHGRFTPADGAPSYAIADLFRLDACKIVEHWDVVAPPPNEQRNPNSRF